MGGHLLNDREVIRLPYRTSRSGLTAWEIVLPRKRVMVTRRVNLHRTLRDAAIDALEQGVGFYLRSSDILPWEAEAIFPNTIQETECVSNWRRLWFAYALAWTGQRHKFELSPKMAYCLLIEDSTRAESRRHFSTYFGGHVVHRITGEWMLIFKK
jgi:hypothetical protein